MAGCVSRNSSISRGEIFSPPRMIMSFARPVSGTVLLRHPRREQHFEKTRIAPVHAEHLAVARRDRPTLAHQGAFRKLVLERGGSVRQFAERPLARRVLELSLVDDRLKN